MKDDDLRASFDSADAEKNTPSATEETPVTEQSPGSAVPARGADGTQQGAPSEGGSSQSFRVPSFDELMGFAPPAEVQRTQAAANDAPEPPASDHVPDDDLIFAPRPAAAAPTTPAAPVTPSAHATPTAPAASADPHASAPTPAVPTTPAVPPTPPTPEDDLAPLVLPGFSSEPQQREPLPPLFQADQSRRASADRGVAQSEPQRFDDFDSLPPTQPITAVELGQSAGAQNHDQGRGEAREEPSVDTSDGFAALGLGGFEQEAAPAPQAAPSPAPAAPTAPQIAPPTAPLPAAPRAAANVRRQSAAPEEFSPRRSGAVPPSSDDDYEKISVTGGEKGRRRALPWIIVGGGVLIALIASMFVINALRSPGSDTTPSPSPTATSEPTPEPEPEPTTPTETPEPEPEPDEAPVVDVGAAFWIPITQWGLDVEKSQRLGTVTYSGLTDEGLTLEIELAASLPEACAAQRTGWGLTKHADGTLEAVRPMPRCADADGAAVYDTIWGLVDHMAKSVRPSE